MEEVTIKEKRQNADGSVDILYSNGARDHIGVPPIHPAVPPDKKKVYFGPNGFVCECGHLMIGETHQGQARVFCTNLNCQDNLVTKVINLPEVTEYVLG
jgi:hypothetical protein